jgi:hypothetical protein
MVRTWESVAPIDPSSAPPIAGGAYIVFYVCATIDLVERRGAYTKINVCATRVLLPANS